MKEVIFFWDQLSKKAIAESNCFPVDRYFLEPYITKIKSFPSNEFLIHTLESSNLTYSIQLMFCLPELWDNIDIYDLEEIYENSKNVFFFYNLITFFNKYIEINLIPKILSSNLNSYVKQDVILFLKRQYPTLLKSETDIFFIENNILGINNEHWSYFRQKILLADDVEYGFNDFASLEKYIKSI